MCSLARALSLALSPTLSLHSRCSAVPTFEQRQQKLVREFEQRQQELKEWYDKEV
jgi:hypothetical protein